MSLPLHITIIIMVGISASNPVPQFVFPEQKQQKQKYVPGEDRDAIQSCLEQDYSMPFFNETDQQVQAVFCTTPIFELCYLQLYQSLNYFYLANSIEIPQMCIVQFRRLYISYFSTICMNSSLKLIWLLQHHTATQQVKCCA